MAHRAEKHFRAAGRNDSKRKYKNVIIIPGETEDAEVTVSCRPARAQRALKKLNNPRAYLKQIPVR